MKRLVIELSDGSELDVHYIYDSGERQTWDHPGTPATWELEELYHLKKVDSDSLVLKDQPTVVTNLAFLIETICSDKVFESLYEKIGEAIDKAEADPTPDLLEETPRREV